MDEYLERPNARIAYSSSPPGASSQTLVVTHSLATSRAWEDEAGILDWTAVTRLGHRLVRVDSRGHGESTGEPVPEHYEWTARADDLIAVADAVSPHQPIDGLGESTGCGVLLWAAVTAPERFRRLLLIIPPTIGDARAEQGELYRAAADLIELRGGDAWQRLTVTATPAPILQQGGWIRPEWVPVTTRLLPSVLRGAASSTFPDDPTLATIQHRTLILTWQGDPSHPTEAAEHLAAQLPNSTLHIASSPDQIRAWGQQAATFLTTD